MNKLQKMLLAGLVASGLGISTVAVHAQPMERRGACAAQNFDTAQFAARMAKRQAELHDKLALKEDQEAAWKAFAEQIKPGEQAARPDWKALSQLTAPERMEKMLSFMKDRETKMSSHLAALKTFYAVLTPAQQKIFDEQFSHHGQRRARKP
ncbi:MAG: Spy/CpxP family protein refolding chaperone [Sulfuricella sp.]|nr:Spy/CpxP family protein refolding chaperone [Sulfuricella sp.]